MEEIWRPVKEYEGYYEVSNLGRVRSIDRVVVDKSGRRQREVVQGMEMETETLEQYLNRMRKLGENQ